ncbi:hypothetical protein NDU88_004950 [Pleurodeles waltl]|uniref:Uncharacterized protein n=1 Tax=Pleurodeles waltl TaxID=8319 RepID=A0AAV7UHF4_PLEWA|nr:hypothetical protein NDU88_004950 [Pleurodeles waltl]
MPGLLTVLTLGSDTRTEVGAKAEFVVIAAAELRCPGAQVVWSCYCCTGSEDPASVTMLHSEGLAAMKGGVSKIVLLEGTAAIKAFAMERSSPATRDSLVQAWSRRTEVADPRSRRIGCPTREVQWFSGVRCPCDLWSTVPGRPGSGQDCAELLAPRPLRSVLKRGAAMLLPGSHSQCRSPPGRALCELGASARLKCQPKQICCQVRIALVMLSVRQ